MRQLEELDRQKVDVVTRIILLNGPRQVGKDFIADKFVGEADSARKLPIMWLEKLAAMAEHGVPPSHVHAMERFKDEPINGVKDWQGLDVSALHGKTPRQVYIEYGERMRAEEGDTYFAKLWAKHAAQYRGYGYIVVPDVRFQPEVDEAVREFGAHNVLLVRVRQENYGWANDIGSYLKHMFVHDFDNTAQSPDVGIELHDVVRRMML